ncbi:hypothetical protein BH11PSE8_BH11PSE8_00230 [soil metagenome]
MNRRDSIHGLRLPSGCALGLGALVLAACGGGSGGGGNTADSGTNKTTLTVEATDADGDTLQYQWRVTAGSIDNRNARSTVWTMPDGPGLHFAYVSISDGRGGVVQQQYAVATDALGTTVPARQAVSHVAPPVADFRGTAARLRFVSADTTLFTPPAGGTAASRVVYLPDVQVQVVHQGGSGETVFSGLTDLSGEVSLPKLVDGESYAVNCATSSAATPVACGNFSVGTQAGIIGVVPALSTAANLRLHGHIGLADGGNCGTQDEFFGDLRTASVQLQQADGTALMAPLRVNRFGDYALDAAVPVKGVLKMLVQCEGYSQTLDVPVSPNPAGYVSTVPIELSHQVPNNRPRVVKMVANGPDGNVRGQMVELTPPGAVSDNLPGPRQFLTYKGKDTRLSACMYYRALGAVKECDAQGGMVEPVTFDDWKAQRQFKASGDVAANYINKMDLNLVRRMVATQSGPKDIAFYVCNHPGPLGSSQAEVDAVLSTGLADEKRVACVAMEWTTSPGVNGNQPFTKFLTFGPDGSLLPSINLDGRGEKYMPGACVACHGGSQYNGRFPDKGNPSPYLGSGFLPFDTGNYLFGSNTSLGEAAQSKAFHTLNQLVLATEEPGITALSELMAGWYAPASDTLDKSYVPAAWKLADAASPGAARFYREVVGSSCRTCHVSLGPTFNWDATVLSPARANVHVCGGTADIANNASMPNALISRDRVEERVRADPALAALMKTFLGCDVPLPDPVYPKR